MMTEFKLGDVVVRKEWFKTGPIRGTVVLSAHSWMRLRTEDGIECGGIYSGYYELEQKNLMKTLNKKAKPEAEKPVAGAYYVRHKAKNQGVALSARDNPNMQIPATMIADYNDARAEANRLAELYAGNEFVILAVVCSVKKVPVYQTEIQEYVV